MKRIGGLFDRIADGRTIVRAAWRASRGKRHRKSVRRFLSGLDTETEVIVASLQAGSYRFSPYRSFEIRDPKTRTIHAPDFRDRVVHHAIIGVAGPVFETGATGHSYACRRGFGQHAALERLKTWTRRANWFLKFDVRRFYDSVSHDQLREALRRRFRERRLLALFDSLLASYCTGPGFGLPIGALTSQYLGNFFLDPFDHWVLQTLRVPHYLRYMDDMLFLGNHEILHRARNEAPAILEGFGLVPKGGGILNRCALGVPFLGFTLYPDRLRLDRRGRRRLRRRWKAVEKAFEQGRIGEATLSNRTGALFAHASRADDTAWRREILKFSRIGKGEAPETDAPRVARRLVEQYGQELPLRHPQQEQGGQPQQEQRLPGLSVSRHGDESVSRQKMPPPDVAPSRARPLRDETARQPPPGTETRLGRDEEGPGWGSNCGTDSKS